MTDELLASQRTYYDERAPDYLDPTKLDRRSAGFLDDDVARSLVDDFAPTGRVVELACGTGGFTKHLVGHADALTVVDASPKMLERCREAVGDATVTYVRGDIFTWEPDGAYDTVFFGFWLSHVPPARFAAFWDLVERALAPCGRVAFVDEDDRGSGHDDVVDLDGIPAARRTLADGRSFDIVKVFWHPDELSQQLRDLGWNIEVRRVGDTFLFGTGSR